MLCRPMKDFLLKELAIYNRYKKLETTDIPNISTMLPAKSSLNQLSERVSRMCIRYSPIKIEFIFGLQEEFPHTVHTVLRSVDKLKTASTPSTLLCPLCSGYTPCMSIVLTYISRLSRSEIQEVTAASTARSGACISCNCGASPEACNKPSLEQYVCYACKRLLSEGIGKNVPSFVAKRAEAMASAVRSEGLRYVLPSCVRLTLSHQRQDPGVSTN